MCPPPATTTFIDVHALRVGMFVHLDSGWMSHPFPLSSFKITSPAQVSTIRSLGLRQVRWNPQQSDPGLAPADGDGRGDDLQDGPVSGASAARRFEQEGVDAGADARADGEANADAATFAATSGERSARPAGVGAHGRACGGTGGRGDHEAPLGHRAARRLAASAASAATSTASGMARGGQFERQRAAMRRCERQFSRAATACKATTDMILLKPEQARARAEALTAELLDQMLGEHELCIRLMAERSDDRGAHHALNVTVIALLMGRSFGLGAAELLDLGVGAMLHDMGKADMPLRLRHRDESFTHAEHRDYEEHVAHGLAHARRMGLSPGATLVVAQHHELADGSGFPLRLQADRMTAGARIVALVDRYDNLCNPHFGPRGLTPHEALSLLFTQGKDKYETTLLNGFIRMMGVYPPGSTVQLTDDRHALVLAANSSRPLKPQVLVHEPGVPRERALTLDLACCEGVGIRRSVRVAQLPRATFEYLAPRARVAYYFEPAVATEAAAD